MTDRILAFSRRGKVIFLILTALAAIGLSVWVLSLPVPDFSCVTHATRECGRKPLQHIIGYYASWPMALLSSLTLLKIILIHGSAAPLLVLDATGIHCRVWGRTLAWAEIRAAQAKSSAGHWETPKAMRSRALMLTVNPGEASPSLWRRLGGRWTYYARNHDPVAGKYRLVLSWFDQHPDALTQDIRSRLDPGTKWLD